MAKESVAKQIRNKFLRYQSARSKWERAAIQDNEFYMGNQWTKEAEEELRMRNQMPIVVNVIAPAVEQGVAMLTTNKPRFASTGREDSDVVTGRIFSDILSYIWEISDGNTELKASCYDYYVKGLGYLMAYIDPFSDFGRGDVKVKSLSSLDVYVDPSSKKRLFTDAASIIVSQVLSKDELEYRYPNFTKWDKAVRENDDNTSTAINFDTMESTSMTTFDADVDYYRVIDCYTKKKTKAHKLYDPTIGKERIFHEDIELQNYLKQKAYIVQTASEIKYVSDEQEIRNLEELVMKTGGQFSIDPQTGELAPIEAFADTATTITEVTIEYLLSEGMLRYYYVYADNIERVMTIGDVEYYNAEMNISHYPIVPLVANHNRDPYPFSDVRKSKGLQEYINKTRSLILAHAASATNVKLLIPRGATDRRLIQEEWGRAGTGVIEYDAELGKPEVAGPIALPNELYRNEAEAKRDVELLFGIWAAMHGDPNGMHSTFKGTVALDEMGQRRIKSKKDDIEASLNQLAKVVVEMVQQTYTEEKTFRLIRPNNATEVVKLNQSIHSDITGEIIGRMNDVTVGKYDVVVVSGSMLPSNRWAIAEYYMELYKLGLIDQIEVLKKTEVVDIEGVLGRHGQMQQMGSALQQAQKELQDLQGDLQTAQRETMHALQKAELEKFKAKLAQASNTVDHAAAIYSERLKDEEKMRKEAQKEKERPQLRSTTKL
jgi:hypothetical protein